MTSISAVAADRADRPAQPRTEKPALQQSAPVTPHRFDGNVRELPAPDRWLPGDPVREIPRRIYLDPDSVKLSRVGAAQGIDPLLAVQAGAATRASRAFSTPDRNWDGQGFSGVNPPDTVGDVGLNHYVQMINDGAGATVRIYDKALPTPNVVADFVLDSLGSGSCASGFGDPIVLYDRLADRWMLSEFSSSGNNLCMYISQTADPTGSYFAYAFTAPSFPDYPKYGVWPTDANGGMGSYIVTSNESGSGIYAMDRAAMLSGAATTFQRFLIADLPGFGFNAVTPADLDGANTPPSGAPAIIMRHRDTEVHSGPAAPADLLEMWHYDVDWVTPANTTLTAQPSIDVAEFESDLCGLTSFNCFPQPGTGTTLDPLREVIMNRLQYLQFPDYEVLVGNFVVDVDGTDHGGLRWFELRRTGGAAAPWLLEQEGTYSPDADHRFMAGSAMDQSGNIAIAYNVSSAAATFPSLRYTGRLFDDAAGTMTQGETSIAAGSASNSSNRYGDYSAMNLDPEDDCTFWFTGEYNSASNWSTRIATFRFDACGCDLFPLPLTITGGVAGPNQVDLAWDDSELPEVVEYRVLRSRTTGGPYTTIATVADTSLGAGNSGSYAYSDTGVSGGIDYFYIVRASDGAACNSDPSNELAVTATGACTLPPLFAGLETVETPNTGICTLNLSWSAATPECVGPISYEIYRSTTPGFTPAPVNLLSTTLLTSYSDADVLTSGADYYYIVRAIDDSNSVSEMNTVEISGVPAGLAQPPAFSDDGGDTGVAQLTTSAPWTLQGSGGNVGPGHYSTGDYGDNTCSDLVTPAINLGVGNVLSFWSRYDIESSWDKGEVQISTDGGSVWTRVELAYPGSSTQTSDQCGLGTGDFFTGTDTNWNQFTADLSAWDNQTVMLRWEISTDGSVTRTVGWNIDDIVVGNGAAACATASSCADNPIVDVTPDGPLTECPLALPLLTANLTGGVGSISYQWYQDGSPIPGATSSTFQPVDGGTHEYNVRVQAVTCPDEVADGQGTQIAVESAPQFAGLVSVDNQQSATCAIALDWDTAVSVCPGPVVYNVYRSTSPGVTATPGNLIASGLGSTSYADAAGVMNGTTYHYLVRSIDTSTGQTDANSVEGSEAPSGPDTLAFSDDGGDTGAAQLTLATPWTADVTGGHDGPGVYATGLYPNDVCAGIDTPTFNVNAGTLSFWSRAEIENSWDKGEVQISTDGGANWTRVEVAYPGTSTNTADQCSLGTGDFFTGTAGSSWAEYTADLSAYSGLNAMLRWEFSTDGSVTDDGWWIDDIRVFDASTCATGVGGPSPAPDGSLGTTPLRGENLADGVGDTLQITWDASCSATDYNLIYGDLASVASYAISGSDCSLGNSGSHTWNGVPAGDLYFLVVGTDGGTESSWGGDSAGFERNGSTISGECGVSLKDASGSCP